MAFFKRSGDVTPMAEINITPIVGLLLALVTVFAMFGTPADSRKLPMYFSQASCGLGSPIPRILELSIKDTREIYLEGRSLTDGQLASQLRESVISSTEFEPLKLVVRSDPTTPYERFAEILALAQRSGVDLKGIRVGDFY